MNLEYLKDKIESIEEEIGRSKLKIKYYDYSPLFKLVKVYDILVYEK